MIVSAHRTLGLIMGVLCLPLAAFAAAPQKSEVVDLNAPISYWKQIRPVFQANCQGCHQPALSLSTHNRPCTSKRGCCKD